MKGTIVAIVVIVATVSFEAAGFPQGNTDLSVTERADGFIFDGPADRPPSSPGSFRTTTTASSGFPSRPPVFPTQPPVFPTQPPVNTPPPASDIPSPAVVQCARNCPVTPEYNPVCGSDGSMYNNPGHLACVRNCGIRVEQLYVGRCASQVARG